MASAPALPAPQAGRARSVPAPSRTLALTLFQVLILFNVALPKGGITAGGFPVTWGYLALIPIGGLAVLGLLRRPALSVWPFIQAFLLFLPMVVLVYAKFDAAGISQASMWTYVALFGALPIAVLAACAPFLEDIPADDIARALRWALRFAVLWGVMNFLFYAAWKDFIEVPYLTINAGDAGEIFAKNNRRGSLMKLISTYNNGNIFGVCMVMLWPLYMKVEPKRIFKLLFVLAVVLSLSRTAWFGLIAATLLCVLSGHLRALNSSLWIGIFFGTGLVVLLLPLLGWTPDSLVNANLGGRIRTIDDLSPTLWGSPNIRIPELIYVGLYQSFGVLGFTLVLLALFLGPLYGIANWNELSELRRGAVLGTLSYLLTAAIDGAFVFPPTLLLFLFLTALIYRRGLRPRPVATAAGVWPIRRHLDAPSLSEAT